MASPPPTPIPDEEAPPAPSPADFAPRQAPPQQRSVKFLTDSFTPPLLPEDVSDSDFSETSETSGVDLVFAPADDGVEEEDPAERTARLLSMASSITQRGRFLPAIGSSVSAGRLMNVVRERAAARRRVSRQQLLDARRGIWFRILSETGGNTSGRAGRAGATPRARACWA